VEPERRQPGKGSAALLQPRESEPTLETTTFRAPASEISGSKIAFPEPPRRRANAWAIIRA
jgi:hypothetical protein